MNGPLESLSLSLSLSLKSLSFWEEKPQWISYLAPPHATPYSRVESRYERDQKVITKIGLIERRWRLRYHIKNNISESIKRNHNEYHAYKLL